MKTEWYRLKNKALCKYANGICGHELPKGTWVVRIDNLYIGAKFQNIFLCKKHAINLMNDIKSIVAP